MSRIIGDRREKSALDEMEEIARARNADVAEEERMEKLEDARRAKEEAEEARKRIGNGIIQKSSSPEVPGDVTRNGPALGLLYSHSAGNRYTTLYYFSLGDSKNYSLLSTELWIQAIFATDENVYYGKCEEKNHGNGICFEDSVCSLFTGNSFKKKDKVHAIEMVGGTLVDSGHYGLDDTLAGNNYLEKLPIISLAERNGNLYALLSNSESKHLVRIEKERKAYAVRNTLIHYQPTTIGLSQAIIAPSPSKIGKEKTLHYAVVSCAYGTYLDINGRKIPGTEDEKGIRRLALLNLEGIIADIAYCREGAGEVTAIRVDLGNRNVDGIRTLISKAGDFHAIHPVRSLSLHSKLVDYASKNNLIGDSL
ncbi:MAG: hypothetical protein WC852_02555 [Candidatus Nanoarchaeia archaeon]|jgi:hypothetical protein